jgi:NAD(P)-dependent dehydrogenase (short-subunit alcohol dehydrogenase family)
VAVVTGAARGIGRTIALALAREGAELVLVDIGPLELVESEVLALGSRVLALTADVSKEDEVARLAKGALDEFGSVDVLVNNAGIQGPTLSVCDISLAAWQETLTVDLTGPFLCVREFLSSLAAQKQGSIINIASTAALKGVPLRSPYCAAKMGLVGLTKALAMEFGPSGIRVNAVCPGPVDSPAVEEVVREKSKQTGEPFEVSLHRTLSGTALNRPITMAEVAETVVFLASDSSSGITGQVITVAGG